MTVPSGADDSKDRFAAGFAASLSLGRSPVMLSIDMMRAYFDQSSPLCLPSKDCLQGASRVMAAARDLGVPVIHTVVRYGPEGADGGVFFRKVPALAALIGETEMGQIMPEVAVEGQEQVIAKQYPSAFFGTGLASQLTARGIDTVIITGVSTSGCIRATAVDAIQHGFIPVVVSDAVGDRDDSVHSASIYDLQAKYAEVMDGPAVLRYLESLGA